MNLQSQIQNVISNITEQLEARIMIRIKDILHNNYPSEGIFGMTNTKIIDFIEDNNLELQVENTIEDVRAGFTGEVVSWYTTTNVKVFRREELK